MRANEERNLVCLIDSFLFTATRNAVLCQSVEHYRRTETDKIWKVELPHMEEENSESTTDGQPGIGLLFGGEAIIILGSQKGNAWKTAFSHSEE